MKFADFCRRPIFNLGFRIFFLSSALSGAFFMLWWLLSYSAHWPLPVGALKLPQYWHGHEMLFGFGVAVVGGFLLTAVQNWTGVPMPKGEKLFWVWLPWLLARLVFLIAPALALLGGLLDLVFSLLLASAVLNACRAAEGQLKRQAGIIAKLYLLVLANGLFLLGLLTKLSLMRSSLYLTLFVIIGLVITIGRRVMPFFTRNGLMPQGVQFEPKNDERLDKWCLNSFLTFFFLELLTLHFASPWLQVPASLAALATGVLNAKRLAGWFHPGIFRVPLLWSMFFAFATMIVGFGLYALQAFGGRISDSLAMHSFALGGIGMMVLSMMGRVSLGHTGRNIMAPPGTLIVGLWLLVLAYGARVLLPLFWPAQMVFGIWLAQSAWIGAFGLLIYSYTPIWLSPRIDGKKG